MYLSHNAWTTIRRVYDIVHMALWALLVAGTVFLLWLIRRSASAEAREFL